MTLPSEKPRLRPQHRPNPRWGSVLLLKARYVVENGGATWDLARQHPTKRKNAQAAHWPRPPKMTMARTFQMKARAGRFWTNPILMMTGCSLVPSAIDGECKAIDKSGKAPIT